MKICYIVAEYNPFHNGHLKQIEYVKKNLSPEKIVVILSGNFVQRGEPAVLNKYVRATHAVMAGADAVIELPTVFALSNAEVFSKGAISVIKSINQSDCGICFGVESGEKEDYLSLAKMLNDESKEYKKALKQYLDKGESLCKAKIEALKELKKDVKEELLLSPNNILGVEYTKAILKNNLNVEIFPLKRENEHNDKKLSKKITSALSIRQQINTKKYKPIKSVVPRFVYRAIKKQNYEFEKIALSKIYLTPAEDIKKVLDCTEGLENRIKALCKNNYDFETVINKITTKRYTSSRIRRIIYSNLLGITGDLIEKALKADMYIKVLAVSDADVISLLRQNSLGKVITRKSDTLENKDLIACYAIDDLANDLYNLVNNETEPQNKMIIL